MLGHQLGQPLGQAYGQVMVQVMVQESDLVMVPELAQESVQV
jgi:hypothetical protein